ncbi:hypothetical protein DYB25_013809 [Aphanomyces astaci]|uniref:Phosphatidylinositol transfer protein N-terminal domain-containing protein n=2 Tax=Aphanomyces astaci TaxID=112090 RepID=A0A397BV44_APHAT|nr:hypothetical protein DYB25_013809 [Aphanomyces astaci]RHY24105.1 hypothetical protein DYB36_003114 [Aphanomyces astaci]RHY34230.1 hypothetical protein DYB34_012755 [Aphanomyces astaci]RHY39149.1 hypothetical protein DYB38_010328 [Aphanomyces astaci]RHY80053.1 hypothetical protein DYB30_012953 [Aphanomyces astaci]
MLLHEFRIPLHMNVEEFQIAELYMTMADTVQVIKNEPYDNRNGHLGKVSAVSGQPIPRTHGQYTLKCYTFDDVPALLSVVLPQGHMTLIEETWNSYPTSISYLTSASSLLSKSKFVVTCESVHLPGYCEHENALGLSKDDLRRRSVQVLHIHRPLNQHAASHQWDPSTYTCTKSGRGPLSDGWELKQVPVMTVYKVMRIQFDYVGLRQKMERAICGHLEAVLHRSMRKLQCMSHRWYNLSMADIRILEAVVEFKRSRP